MRGVSTVERAFELAREGRCRSVAEIRRQLFSERYPAVDSHLAGPTLRKQLAGLMRAAEGTLPG